MQRSFKLILLTLVLSLILFASTAQARDIGPYFSVNIGQSEIDIPTFDEGTSFSLGLGYSVNRIFAFEVGYIDFGDVDDGIPPVWTLSSNALTACAIGKIPFNPRVSGFGKLGLFSWDAELHEDGTGVIASDTGSDITFGLGLLFDFNEQISGTIQYQYFELDDIELDNTSIGFQFNF